MKVGPTWCYLEPGEKLLESRQPKYSLCFCLSVRSPNRSKFHGFRSGALSERLLVAKWRKRGPPSDDMVALLRPSCMNYNTMQSFRVDVGPKKPTRYSFSAPWYPKGPGSKHFNSRYLRVKHHYDS